jgi:hypothetical protein
MQVVVLVEQIIVLVQVLAALLVMAVVVQGRMMYLVLPGLAMDFQILAVAVEVAHQSDLVDMFQQVLVVQV